MNRHMRAGWKAARVGLGIGLFSIFSEGFGVVVFGDAPEWGLTLLAASLMTVLFGVGGVFYGIILPVFARRRTPASAWASILAGIAAGVATMAIFAAPFLMIEPMVAAIMLGMGAWMGTIGGFYATKTRRTESLAVHPGEA